jgi:GAF domain-containing protein
MSQREGLLQPLTELGRRIFDAAACSLAVLETDEEHLRFVAASGEGAGAIVGQRLPVSRGIAGWVVSSGQPIAVDDVRRDPRFARDVAETTGYVPRSILAAPVETSRDTLGIVEVLDRTPIPGRDEMRLLALLAQQAATCLAVGAGHADSSATSNATPLPETAALFAEVGALGAEDQRAAVALLREFVGYLRRRGGRAGLV